MDSQNEEGEEKKKEEVDSDVSEQNDVEISFVFDREKEIKRQLDRIEKKKKRAMANTIDNLPTDKHDMWEMVRKTREHYTKYLKEFFEECQRVDNELATQAQKEDKTKNEHLLMLREQLKNQTSRKGLNQKFCVPISTNIKQDNLFHRLA